MHVRSPSSSLRSARRRRLAPCRDRRGATAVEFALVAIIITFLFLAAIELTRLNLIRHTAANAAYEGARQAIVAGGTENDARQAALKLLNGIGIGNGATADVEEQFNRVTVTVSVPVRQNSWGVLRFISGGVVRQSCTLRREISLSSP